MHERNRVYSYHNQFTTIKTENSLVKSSAGWMNDCYV